jgi:hypothetical protein
VTAGRPGPDGDGTGEVVDLDERGRGGRVDERPEVVAAAGEEREVEAGDVLPGALHAPPGVDGDQAAARAQHAEHDPDLRGPVAQQHPDGGARARHEVGDGLDGRAQLPPGPPAPLELQGRRHRFDAGDGGDPFAERVPVDVASRHRILGSRLLTPRPRCFASAIPIGLPTRV